MSRDHRTEHSRPNDRIVTVECDGLYADEINELQRRLDKSRYAFRVSKVATSLTDSGGGSISFLQLKTSLSIRFSLKLLRTERGAVNAIVKAVDDTLSESAHEKSREPKVIYGPNGQIVITVPESTRPRSKKQSWSRTDTLTVGSVVVAIVVGISAFVIPEVRQFLHLEMKPKPIEAQTTPVIEQTPVIANPEPKKTEPPNPKKPPNSHKATTYVKGNANVAGNNVTGSNNVTGNDNQVTPIAVAPNGIAITGGNVQNPTVNNNYGPVPRHLLDQTKNKFIECLRKKPGRFSIGALENNIEAYKYAEDWRSVFISAGWEIEHKGIPIQMFTIGGGMWSGIQIRVHDASPTQGQMVLATGSAEQNLHECLLVMNGEIPGGGSIIPYKDFPTGSARIDISDQPQQK